jgi:uncharacterized protein (TIGR03437 family)
VRLSFQLATAVLLVATTCPAAYQYIHYPNRTNFTPIYEKFNLDSLPNKTVTFYVADQAPNQYPNNEFGSVLSQVRQALAAWNSVAASDLRVAFGGMQSYTSNPSVAAPGAAIPNQATPAGDILFVDTPGVLGLSAPTTSTAPAQGATGQFFPIVRSVVMISRDTSDQPWPSSREAFFTTAVHEIGHALGLQHTWTGSAMSQGIIRTTSRARPLDADDIASLATLYGKAGWQSGYGSIAGRVSLTNGGPVTLASVVAMAANGPAISALTNPDGTYRIDGLPLGYSYYVYAHALPPDAIVADGSGLRRPVDNNYQPFSASGPFQSLLFDGGAGTLDPQRAVALTPTPQGPVTANFTVQPRTSVRTYNVQTYSRIVTATREWGGSGDQSVLGYPGFINPTTGKSGLVIVQSQDPALLPVPQSVTILGAGIPATTAGGSVLPYSPRAGDYIALYFLGIPRDAGAGPRHMIFSFGDDLYAMPNGVNFVQHGPPVAQSATGNADGTVTISGAGFGPDSRVYFDGAQATGVVFNGSDAQGTLTVVPPPGANGQSAQVTVYTADGQNSTMIPGSPQPTYTYPATGAAQGITVTPNAVPAGTMALVEVNVSGMTLVDGHVTVGFGSADVQARRVWVLSPTRALVNVWATTNATAALSQISVISGMQVTTAANAFQVLPSRTTAPAIWSVTNADPSVPTVTAGQFATIFGLNLAGAQVTLNDVPANVVFSNANQVNFVIPAGAPAGAATLRVGSTGGTALPLGLQIDAVVPAIVNASAATASAGDVLALVVAGVDATAAGRLRVTASGLDMNVLSVNAGGGVAQVQTALTQSFGASAVPVVVWLDGTPSAPVNVVIR